MNAIIQLEYVGADVRRDGVRAEVSIAKRHGTDGTERIWLSTARPVVGRLPPAY